MFFPSYFPLTATSSLSKYFQRKRQKLKEILIKYIKYISSCNEEICIIPSYEKSTKKISRQLKQVQLFLLNI